ncbi:MAG: hypothetical protein V4510_08165 [bacterium]
MGNAIAVIAMGLALAAAGCAGHAEDASTSPAANAPTGPMPPATNATLGIANVTTDGFHFLVPPLLGLGPANHTILTPKGATYQAQTFTWNATLHGKGLVTGAEIDLFLRITGTQVQAGGQDPGCTATATYYFTHNATQRGFVGGCGSLGLGTVTPGDRELRFAAPPDAFATPQLVGPGDGVVVQVTLQLENAGFAPTCYILGGPDWDSNVRFIGLNETVPSTPPAV